MQSKMIILMVTALFTSTGYAGAEKGSLGKFRNTYYYLVNEAHYDEHHKDAELLDLDDHVLAKVSSRFKAAADIEGSAKLVDGRVVNFAGRKGKEIRWKVTKNAWGDGVGTCALIPFHSIAVDPGRIPLGSVVQIKETIGMLLPDGTRHDGLWRAEDVGGAIKKDRVDLYVGDDHKGVTLDKAKITHLQPLTITLVEAPPVKNCANND